MTRTRMPSKLVTCPETAHLEEIEYDDHPLGMLIRACSRFAPPCAIGCERRCAMLLDRKRRATGELGRTEDTVPDAIPTLIAIRVA